VGRADELRQLLRVHADRLADAAGSLGAYPYEVVDGGAGEFVLDAWWRDEPALQAHYCTADYADYVTRIGELLARPSDVTVHMVERSYRPTANLSLDPSRQD